MTQSLNDFASRTSAQDYHFRHKTPPNKAALARVKAELRRRGAVAYNMWLPETNYLPHILHQDEHIMGSVYGRYNGGRGTLIATNQRVLFLDKKPMFLHCDELTFMIVGGVTYTHTFLYGYVTLHTRLGDFGLRTLNQKNAANFVDYIETKCLQNMQPNPGNYDALT